MGFEPTGACALTGFQDQLLKPLGHPSRAEKITRYRDRVQPRRPVEHRRTRNPLCKLCGFRHEGVPRAWCTGARRTRRTPRGAMVCGAHGVGARMAGRARLQSGFRVRLGSAWVPPGFRLAGAALPVIQVTHQIVDRHGPTPTVADFLEHDRRPPLHADRLQRLSAHAQALAGDRADEDTLVT